MNTPAQFDVRLARDDELDPMLRLRRMWADVTVDGEWWVLWFERLRFT